MSSTSQEPSTETTGARVGGGIAGRTNYDQWDKVTRTLVEETEQADQQQSQQGAEALGLDGKYARSQAEAEEREKAEALKATKKKLDKLQERQDSLMQTFESVLNDAGPQTWRLTRAQVDAFKRVVMLRNVKGTRPEDSKLVLTQDLSLLESQMPASALRNPKSYPDDAENAVTVPPPQQGPSVVLGLIKVILEELENCTVLVKCKLITGTIEFHRCHNVHIVMDPSAVVTTIQADLSSDIMIQFRDPETPPKIYHAGVSNMTVQLEKEGVMESQLKVDYQNDGALAMGTATKEEFRFVTQLLDGQWTNEIVAKTDAVALTERELKLEQERREKATKMAMAMADDMVQIKDKDGNVLVKKDDEMKVDDTKMAEITMSMEAIALEECGKLKAQGNEAFTAGQYGQAILQYSLALDKAAQLKDEENLEQFPQDVVYSNRAACFLKLGQHEKAEQDARDALKHNPGNLKANFRLGLSLHAAGRYSEALTVLAQAHKMEPQNKQIKQALQFAEVRMEQEHRKRMTG